MLDALTFVLYGKPYRNINKPQLINSVNGKNCLVEINFTIGKKEYLVRRGIKPNIFEIFEDGELIDQDSRATDYQLYLEKNILQMNYTAFTQIVVLGKATYIPFMRLKLNDRRQLIEELLGLTIFSKMNEVLKNRFSDVKSRQKELESEIVVVNEKIEFRKKYIKKLSTDKDNIVKDIESEISENELKLKEIRAIIDSVSGSREVLFERIERYQVPENKQKKLNEFQYEYRTKIKSIEKKVGFFVDNDICPTCKQSIEEEFKKEELDKLNYRLSDLYSVSDKLKKQIDRVNENLSVVESTVSSLRKLDLIESEHKTKMKSIENTLKNLVKKLEAVSDDKLQQEKDEIEKYHSDLKKLQDEKFKNQTKVGHFQSIGTMLKDTGIKSMIVQKYLPIFNQLINQYLTKFDFFVKFELDDTFNETILSRHKDSFSYSSFSEGEKLRIDMAILLTWREISKMKNAMSTNLLILDEVFDSSLDQTGVDAFIDLIPKMESANIFVISHTPSKLYDKFKNVIEIEKTGNFSVIK